MSLILFTGTSGSGGPSSTLADLPELDTEQFRSTKPCSAGVKIDADGYAYTMLANGTWSQQGAWLLKGANTVHKVKSTVDSGTLTTDAGSTALVCSTDREYTIVEYEYGSTKTTKVTLELQLVSTSAVIDTRQYTLVAQLS